MPEALQDPDTHEWDFKAQHRWLIERLKTETVTDIEEAAKITSPPIEPDQEEHHDEPPQESGEPPWANDHIGDDDVPF